MREIWRREEDEDDGATTGMLRI